MSQELYNLIYRYGDRKGLSFEECVVKLLEVCDPDHLRKAAGVSTKKHKSKIIKDPVTGAWRLSTPLDKTEGI